MIWQTIVLSHSPREDESMLFEEGTDLSKSADVAIDINVSDKKHNHPHTKNKNENPQSPLSKKLDFGKFKFRIKIMMIMRINRHSLNTFCVHIVSFNLVLFIIF